MALKVYKADKRYSEYAKDEVAILEKVESVRRDVSSAALGSDCVVRLLHHFVQTHARCSHPCLAMEALGPDALELAQWCSGSCLPSSAVLALARDTLSGLSFLHDACGIIHTDIKPENILVRLPPSSSLRRRTPPGKHRCLDAVGRWHSSKCADAILASKELRFCIADLGNSCFADRQVSEVIQTCEYRAPEVLLGAGYDCTADLWSFACVVFECAAGEYLFDPHCIAHRPDQATCFAFVGDGSSALTGQHTKEGAAPIGTHAPLVHWGGYCKEEEHLAQMVALVGPLPEPLLKRGKLTGRLLSNVGTIWRLRSSGESLLQQPISDVATKLQEQQLASEVADVVDMPTYIQHLSELLHRALVPDPELRVSAAALLQESSWLLRKGEDV